ncbi:hypothetical protein LDENG_00223160 [Lucifuga dentata]|nr:hypothetical protein LDENG_00223160 [Lucifuga dentata]
MGGSVMLWGCFGGERSRNYLVQVKGIMKKEKYHSILQRHTIPSSLRIIGQNFILQQDNDPKHSSKLCQNYIHSKEKQKALRIKTWPEGATLTKPKSEPEMTIHTHTHTHTYVYV